MTERRAVYTALFGGYEDLGEQPIAHETDIPFICFTDDPTLTSDTWQLEVVEPLFPFDMVRSQRDVKLRGNARTLSFDQTLYIDNSVRLSATPDAILDDWLATDDYAVSLHSYRERVIDEFDEIIALGYDDSSRVQEQLIHYAELYPDALYARPLWNGIICRRNTPPVAAMTALWFDHVLRYSRRDQLSATVAIALSGLKVNAIEQDNWASDIHAWPVEVHRRVAMSKTSVGRTGPILAEVARLERKVIELTGTIDEIYGLVVENEGLRSDLGREVERSQGLEEALRRMRLSVSWRISSPIRRMGSWLRRLRAER